MTILADREKVEILFGNLPELFCDNRDGFLISTLAEAEELMRVSAERYLAVRFHDGLLPPILWHWVGNSVGVAHVFEFGKLRCSYLMIGGGAKEGEIEKAERLFSIQLSGASSSSTRLLTLIYTDDVIDECHLLGLLLIAPFSTLTEARKK